MADKNLARDQLTEQQIDEYVESGGDKCPWCGGTNFDGEGVDIEAGEASQWVTCVTCGRTWLDVYKLDGIIVVDDEPTEGEGDERDRRAVVREDDGRVEPERQGD